MANKRTTYNKSEIISFSNTKASFGGLSNMAPNFPLFVNEMFIPNSEALYQSCRFPLFPDIQERIISQSNAMIAKNISKEYQAEKKHRQDWDDIKLDIMRWVLEVKLIQNWEKFGDILKKTGNKPIVEYSKEDKFWAATPADNNTLVGENALGRLLMEIREKYVIPNKKPSYILAPNITGFLLLGTPIGKVYPAEYFIEDFEEDLALEMA